MPELPEVETITLALATHLVGYRITAAKTHRPALRFPFPPRFAARLKGQTITNIQRRGKYILTTLDNDMIWLSHLGMSGRFIIEPNSNIAHLHFTATTNNATTIGYVDPRRFGYMSLFATTEKHQNKFLKTLGVEPLSNAFTLDYLASMLKVRKTPIKNALLDQRIIAGLGNIYVCEALFRARIHPEHPASELTNSQMKNLRQHIRTTLKDAIHAGGSSLKDFAHPDGHNGYFQYAFQIYGRTGAPCRTRKCDAIIERISIAGRASFFCPKCQPHPSQTSS